MMGAAVTVVLADDNPIVRMGLRSLLDASDEVDLVGEAENGEEAVELVDRLRPDVALLDVRMPLLDGVGASAKISQQAKVLMLTSSEEPEIIQSALAAGASGYLVHGAHSPEEIVAAVLTAARGSMVLGPAAAAAAAAALKTAGELAVDGGTEAGGPGLSGLTRRESEIMNLVADGLTNREIARSCFLAEKTVKNHLNRIFVKLDVRTRAEAVSRWLKAAHALDSDRAVDQNRVQL